jgi:hypothetical protein
MASPICNARSLTVNIDPRWDNLVRAELISARPSLIFRALARRHTLLAMRCFAASPARSQAMWPFIATRVVPAVVIPSTEEFT